MGSEPGPHLGPLVSEEAVKALHADVEKSVAAGARVLTGAKPEGRFYPPTVLADIPRESPAWREELFGPVASLFRVKDIDEAIAVANDTRFGLGASAWTRDAAECERFINDLDAGLVFINEVAPPIRECRSAA